MHMSWLVPTHVTKHVLTYILANISAPRSSWGLKFLLEVGTPNIYKILKGHQAIQSNSWEIKV